MSLKSDSYSSKIYFRGSKLTNILTINKKYRIFGRRVIYGHEAVDSHFHSLIDAIMLHIGFQYYLIVCKHINISSIIIENKERRFYYIWKF